MTTLLASSLCVVLAVCVNGHPSIASEFADSTAVFSGTVLSHQSEAPTKDGFFDDGTTFEVRVDDLLRARATGVEGQKMTTQSQTAGTSEAA